MKTLEKLIETYEKLFNSSPFEDFDMRTFNKKELLKKLGDVYPSFNNKEYTKIFLADEIRKRMFLTEIKPTYIVKRKKK